MGWVGDIIFHCTELQEDLLLLICFACRYMNNTTELLKVCFQSRSYPGELGCGVLQECVRFNYTLDFYEDNNTG